jgi:hypothetical protein
MNELLTIQLTVDQINVILSTVGNLPYATVAPLMNSIQLQANQQLQQLAEAQAAAADAVQAVEVTE